RTAGAPAVRAAPMMRSNILRACAHCSIHTSNRAVTLSTNDSSPSGSNDSSDPSIGSSKAKASSTWPLAAVTWARTIVAIGRPSGSAPGRGPPGLPAGAPYVARHVGRERGGCAQSRCTRLVVRLDPVGFGDEHRVRLGYRADEEHREPAESLQVCPDRRLRG